ncbi:MAG: hypothetical protein CAF43_008620 [Nitrospira sp. CG24C]|jgi:hypothetical protein|nr:MAG: hypothetical protein CAF43_008620 [Nitrospira sp. CG24C]
MKKQVVPFVLVLAVIVGLGLPAHGTGMESATSSASSTATDAVGLSPNTSTKLTPEQGAALVEVRKILREAKQSAESYTLPSKLTTSPTMLRALEQRKTVLLEEIEQAQLRAGDLAAAAGTKRLDLLALAQAQYGDIKGAIQTATRNRVADNELLILVDTVIKAGDIPAAVTMAQSNFAKNGVELWRQRNQAAVYALIAKRQHEAGDPEAPATLQNAIKAVPEPKHTPDRYLALLHVARTQATMGDRAGSEESFRKAIVATLGVRGEGVKGGGLIWVAKAQAEVGAKAASEQVFQQAIQLGQSDKRPLARAIHLGCLAWAQSVSGQNNAIEKTFRDALENIEAIPVAERGQILMEIANWQIKARDLEGARYTVQLLLRRVESLTDQEAKNTAIASAAGLAVLAGDPKQAIELAAQVTDDWERAGVLAAVVRTLVRTHDPFGSPEVFRQLAESAATLLKHSPPKDSSKRDTRRSSLALVLAAAGDVPSALRTADTISSVSGQKDAYGRVANLLTAKRDFASAKQVILAMKEDWLAIEIKGSVLKLTKAEAKAGGDASAIDWTRRQKNMFAKAQALLGVGLGLMEREGIVDIERSTPETPMRDQCPILVDSSL